MKAIDDISLIKELADGYRKHRNLQLTSLSKYAAGRGAYFQELFDDKCGITLRRRDKIIGWFDKNWPVDLEWPDHIPRPQPKSPSEVSHDGI